MKSENQVVSLKLSQKLEQLGFKQDSYFVWIKTIYAGKTKWKVYNETEASDYTTGREIAQVFAYTITELEQWLPSKYQVIKIDSDYWIGAKEVCSLASEKKRSWMFTKSGNLRQGLPDWMFDVLGGSGASNKKHVNALAKLLIYLKQIKEI